MTSPGSGPDSGLEKSRERKVTRQIIGSGSLLGYDHRRGGPVELGATVHSSSEGIGNTLIDKESAVYPMAEVGPWSFTYHLNILCSLGRHG